MRKQMIGRSALCCCVTLLVTLSARAVTLAGSSFTYQGQIKVTAPQIASPPLVSKDHAPARRLSYRRVPALLWLRRVTASDVRPTRSKRLMITSPQLETAGASVLDTEKHRTLLASFASATVLKGSTSTHSVTVESPSPGIVQISVYVHPQEPGKSRSLSPAPSPHTPSLQPPHGHSPSQSSPRLLHRASGLIGPSIVMSDKSVPEGPLIIVQRRSALNGPGIGSTIKMPTSTVTSNRPSVREVTSTSSPKNRSIPVAHPVEGSAAQAATAAMSRPKIRLDRHLVFLEVFPTIALSSVLHTDMVSPPSRK